MPTETKLVAILKVLVKTCHDELTGYGGVDEPCNKDCENCDVMADTMADIRDRIATVMAERVDWCTEMEVL